MRRLRPFIPNDIPSVALMVRDALRENYPTSIFLDLHRAWREGFLIMEENGATAGFLAAIANGPGRARILMLAVQAPFRRRHIGRDLMDAFLGECRARGIGSIELEVRQSNVEAIEFYRRFGFDTVGALPRFYTNGEDGYKMTMQLSGAAGRDRKTR